jgi:hypothetical protein
VCTAEDVAAVAAVMSAEEDVETCGAVGGVADLGGRVGLDIMLVDLLG